MDKVRSAIMNSISHVNIQLERAQRTVDELNGRIDLLNASLNCNHKWDQDAVDSPFDIVECVHCGYRVVGTIAEVELPRNGEGETQCQN